MGNTITGSNPVASAVDPVIERAIAFYEASPQYEEPPKFFVRGEPNAKYEEYLAHGWEDMANEQITLEIQFIREKEVTVKNGFVGIAHRYDLTFQNDQWILSPTNKRGERNHWIENAETKSKVKQLNKILKNLITEKHFKEANRILTANGVRLYVERRRDLGRAVSKNDACIVEMMTEYESLK